MILSVDQGFSNYGYSIWSNNTLVRVGIIQTKAIRTKKIKVADDMIRRHEIICKGLNKVLSRNEIKVLVGEMPGFGAQSSDAAVAMTMASAITLTLCNVHNLKTLWVTPRQLKEHFTGNPDASKEQIMTEACERHGWWTTYKKVKSKKAIEGSRLDPTYLVLGKTYPMGKFEHIADSIAAYHTAKYYHEKG